jgi:hypothetical protein
MCVVCNTAVSLAVVTLGVAAPHVTAETPPAQSAAVCSEADLYCPATSNNDLAKLLQDYPAPAISSPSAHFATPDIKVRRPITQTVKYQVALKGTVGMSLDTFKKQVADTLGDDRGWSRLGVRFELAESGGAFTVVLAQPSQVPSYGAPCDAVWNCNVGNYVIANEDRWLKATDPWIAAGGTVRDYRHLTINHELGHWLGHGHTNCTVAGQAAPVMQQQSMDLRGCKFNAWPLDSELTSTRLGI